MADILDKVAELDTEVSATPKLMPLALYTAPDKAESDSPGFLDVLGRASEQTNLLTRGLIATYEASKDWPSDPNYNYWDHKDELRKDIPPQYWRDIAGANSLEEANHIKWRIQDEIDGQRQVAEAGYSGVAAQLVSGLLSPENIVPMGAAYSWADKGSRLSAAVKTGLVTGASVAAAEAAIVAGTYTKDAEDILYAATFGFTLGAGAGAVLHKTANNRVDSVTQTPSPSPRTSPVEPTTSPPVPKQAQTVPQKAPEPFGPPVPKIITEVTERTIERRTGPIDIDTHVKVNALWDRFQNIDVVNASKKVQQSIAQDFAAIDHRASLDTDTANKLEEIYETVGYRPTETIETISEIGGSWKQLQEDMAYAANELRKEMDTALVDDFDDAGAMRNRDYPSQLVETSEREDDIIDAAYQFVQDKNIQEQLDNSRTNAAAVRSKILSSDFTRLINHESPVVQKIAFDLLEGGTGSVKGRGRTAAQYKDVYERRLLSKGLVPLNDHYAVWAKDNKLNPMERNFHTKGYDTFYAEVRELLESRSVDKTVSVNGAPKDYHPSVVEAADAWDDMMQNALEIAQKAGVESLQGIPTKQGYVPLVWQGSKIQELGRNRARRVISQSYRSLGIDDDMADEIANAVVERALLKKAGVDSNISGLLDKSKRDQLAAQLTSMGLPRERVSNILKRLDQRQAEAGPAFTKNRTKIDLNFEMDGVKVSDLVDNDLNRIASVYAREISGRSGLAKKGITSDAKWEALKAAALKDNLNLDAGDGGKLAEHLDDVKSYFSAYPVAGGINPNIRRLQQSTTLSLLGGIGIAQAAEVGTVIGRVGLKAAAKAIPAAKEAFTLAKSVRASDDPVVNELRSFIGLFDYDHLMYRPDIVLDDKITAATDSSAWMRVIDKGLGKASTFLGYASGMNTVRHFEHQMASRAIIDKFAFLAKNPDELPKQLARLEDIGVEGKELDNIIKSINKYSEFDPETGQLKDINLKSWNEDTAEAFAFAANKFIAQVVQRQLAGETSNWMHKTVGSLLTQFRHFPIVAYEKQLLKNIHFHDQALLTTIMYGFAVSYGIQAIRAGLNGEDMNSEATMKKAVNYMGMASVAPDVMTVAAQIGIAPEALNFRKSGHTGSYADEFDIIDHVPAAGQVNRIVDLASLPAKAMQGEATASDVRASAGAIPLSSLPIVKSTLEAILED